MDIAALKATAGGRSWPPATVSRCTSIPTCSCATQSCAPCSDSDDGSARQAVAALGAVVSNVDEIDNVVPLIEQLGRDHRRFSVITEHYTAVGASLLATLQYFLGRLWMPDLADTWAQAYGLVAKVMVAAAEQHEEVAPASWEADVVRVERRSVEVAMIEVAPREPFPYRAGQSVAVEIPQRPRLWRRLR